MAKKPDYIHGQPPPVPNNGQSIHDLVRRDLARMYNVSTPIHNRSLVLLGTDMDERKKYGLDKYGTILQAGNGRNALADALEEALDLSVYLRQKLEEDKNDENMSPRGRVNNHMLRLAYREVMQAMTYIKTAQMGS